MVSLDATLGTVTQAAEFKADLLVTHHPLWFEPLTQKNFSGPEGQALNRAVREGLAVYSAHTNLDASPQGINTSLADLLDLRDRKILKANEPELLKLVVFVPEEQLENVKVAAFRAQAGRIGNYTGCSFSVKGAGTFTPGPGASPFKGRSGKSENVQEVRLEISVPSQILSTVLSNIHKVHPYEEPAIDIYPVIPGSYDTGLGITGVLPQRSTVGEIAGRVGSKLKTDSIRLVGKKSNRVRKVAVCAGSGASLLDDAVEACAQLYLTGDMKYHDARKAEEVGLNILDIGHFAPERYGMTRFGNLLEKKLAGQDFNVRLAFAKERDPFVTV